MRYNIKYALFLVLLIAGCIKEIQFETEQGNYDAVVVSGDFTNSASEHRIRLSKPNEYGVSAFQDIKGATIKLLDNEGNVAQYEEQLVTADYSTIYVLPANAMPAVVGRAYHIEITLSDGDTYRSKPQILQSVIPMDSLSIGVRTFNRVTGAGVVVEDERAALDVHTTVPAGLNQAYFRWDANCVYYFPELPLPNTPLPPPTKQCYITDNFNDQLIKTLAVSNKGGASFTYTVGARLIDKAFDYKVYFNVVQKRIDYEAFNYFDQASKLSNPSGSVFDPAPGSLQSNLERVSSNAKEVLGYFEVAAVDTMRLVAYSNTLGTKHTKPAYCTGYFNTEHECYNCLKLPNSTLQKPPYWQ